MNARCVFPISLFALVLGFVVGCGKSNATLQAPAALAAATLSPDTIVRVHWLGRKRLDLDVSAYYVSRIWSLPETKRLQYQTCDKLATNTLRMLVGDVAVQIPPEVFRPLFDDIALEECYFELRNLTNSQMPEGCFAIHVNSQRAGSWVTNLVVVAEILTGGSATSEPAIHGWTIQGAKTAQHFTVSHLGDWVIAGFGPGKNPVFDEVADRVVHRGGPMSASSNWLEMDIDLNRTARAFSLPEKTGAEWPRVQFTVTGDGSHIIAQGHLIFSNALPVLNEAWQVPTNLIHEPLLGFTAIRGVQPLIAKSKSWNDLQLGVVPDQLFFWSLPGDAYYTYAAAPVSDASHEMNVLSDFLMQRGNPWLANNGYINFHRAPDSNGVIWGNVSSLKPFIKSAHAGADGWLYAGLLPDPGWSTNAPLSAQILQKLNQETNLVYYDREMTGELLSPRLGLLQTMRQIARKPPLPTDCVSLNWLGILIPRLGVSETTIHRTGPSELSFHRQSTVGLTALELHLLADWLESPDFPRGMHSLQGSEAPAH